MCDISLGLQKPDFKLLQWSEDGDLDEDSKTLGAPLEKGHQLHLDLQHNYLLKEESSGTIKNKAIGKVELKLSTISNDNDAHFYYT